MNPHLDAALDALFLGAAAFCGALLSATPQWTALTLRLQRIQSHQEALMATAAELKTALDGLSAAVTDYTSDVAAKLAALGGQIAQMQATIDTAASQHAVDQATIDALREQLDGFQGSLDDAVASAKALTDAVAAADQPVDQGS